MASTKFKWEVIMLTKEKDLIDLAVSKDNEALETLLYEVQDLIFNLSFRMLGSLKDAEEAAQEINIRIIKSLPNFRGECAFSICVYRICVNTLVNFKKSISNPPFSLESFFEDINSDLSMNNPLQSNVDESILIQEMKASCTNAMLQYLDAEERCIFILGTMFHLKSQLAGQILNISQEAYRQRLSCIKKKMAESLGEYCGLAHGKCNCRKRVYYAIQNKRLSPEYLEYTGLQMIKNKEAGKTTNLMEEPDDISGIFANLPKYKNPKSAREFIEKLIVSCQLFDKKIK
jgi:RNA polymerase sigma factor (sigma-70 family)